MMDLATIKELSRRAAQRARREKRRPFVPQKGDIERATNGDLSAIRIPNLGSAVPKGWQRVSLADDHGHGIYMGDADGFGAYFVDNSGFGAPGEAALTLGQFVKRLRPGIGYGVVEEGQFQVKVGAFRPKISNTCTA